MAVPKKRKSKQKSRQGKAGRPQLLIMNVTECKNCGSPCLPHRICTHCGHYNGKMHYTDLENNHKHEHKEELAVETKSEE